MKTYVVSLASEMERRQHIVAECARFDLTEKIIDAVDMRQATQDDIEKLSLKISHVKPKKQRYLSKGELGCALSHHLAYREIVAQKDEFALILEDDAYFLSDPKPLCNASSLKNIDRQHPFDVLLIGYVKTLPSHLPYYYRRIPLKIRAKIHSGTHTFVCGTPWEQYACGTVAYIISQAGAQKLLAATAKPCATADDWLYFEQNIGLRVLHARPTLVLEDLQHFNSTIRSEKADFLQAKVSSMLIRSLKGSLKNFAMNYLGMK